MSPRASAMPRRIAAPLPMVHRLQELADLRPLARQRGHDVARAVGRLIVDDDDLLVDRHVPHAPQKLRDRRPLVVAGDDHGQQGGRGSVIGGRIVRR